MKIVYGITTFNRLKYLKNHVETWKSTINLKGHKWTLIIADDGSTDGTQEYIKSLSFDPKIEYVPMMKGRRGVHYQVNQILLHASKMKFDVGFKAEDDIYFAKKGWDTRYCKAIRMTGCDHLLYHDPKWRKKLRGNNDGAAKVVRKQESLYAQSRLTHASVGMGVFWTFTPKVLKKVGYFDCENFGLCGNGHQDFTLRCCRAKLNRIYYPWDALNSEDYIKMVYDDYIGAASARTRQVAANTGKNGPVKKLKKGKMLLKKKRIYVPYNEVPYDFYGNKIEE